MAIFDKDGVVESIGLSIDLSKGYFYNTQLNSSGELQLKEHGQSNGKPTYQKTGYWESQVIDTINEYKSLDYIANTNKVVAGDSNFKIFTRTSDDKVRWSLFEEVKASNKIASPKKRYIHVRIEFYGVIKKLYEDLDVFKSEEKKKSYVDSKYIDTTDGLKLSKHHFREYSRNTIQTDDGFVYSYRVNRKEFKKINSLGILRPTRNPIGKA